MSQKQIHGISTKLAQTSGVSLAAVLDKFTEALSQTQFLVGHNVGFDINIMGAELHRFQRDTEAFTSKAVLDTCTENTATLCQLPGGRGGKFKLPTLSELYKHVFSTGFGEAHNATADVEATTRVFLELIRLGKFNLSNQTDASLLVTSVQETYPTEVPLLGLKHQNLKKASATLVEAAQITTPIPSQSSQAVRSTPFAHLHTFSQFSVLQSTIRVKETCRKSSTVRYASSCTY